MDSCVQLAYRLAALSRVKQHRDTVAVGKVLNGNTSNHYCPPDNSIQQSASLTNTSFEQQCQTASPTADY